MKPEEGEVAFVANWTEVAGTYDWHLKWGWGQPCSQSPQPVASVLPLDSVGIELTCRLHSQCSQTIGILCGHRSVCVVHVLSYKHKRALTSVSSCRLHEPLLFLELWSSLFAEHPPHGWPWASTPTFPASSVARPGSASTVGAEHLPLLFTPGLQRTRKRFLQPGHVWLQGFPPPTVGILQPEPGAGAWVCNHFAQGPTFYNRLTLPQLSLDTVQPLPGLRHIF
jgi:hypothetical protein